MKNKAANSEKRAFLKSLLPMAMLSALFSGRAEAAALQEINRPDVLPKRKEMPQRESPVTPPGSKGYDSFIAHCTGCQLCIRACPKWSA